MSPYEPRIENQRKVLKIEPGEEVVISGVAGRYPECDNVEELREKLMRGEDLITVDERRWSIDHPEIPKAGGKIEGLEKFDASFFGVGMNQAHTMDPMSRLLLERAYEAIIDAGVNPRTLRGKQVGVYVGCCQSESEKTWFYEKVQADGLGVTGCSRAMLANRISYWLGTNGPSYCIDTACSSSMYGFNEAFQAMVDGKIDAAVVGGTNLALHPYLSMQFMRLGVLSPRGKCNPFDESADGYVRSEAVVAVFLQRAKDARRIYCTVVNSGTNCDGYKAEGITYPSGEAQSSLMREVCLKAGVDPASVSYVEAHATGTKVGDPEEVAALDQVYCQGTKRKEPLLAGSIKSNMGHTEPVSGLCSISKIILAMENQIMPPTIHVKQPRRIIPALMEGRLKVVTEPTPWKGGLAAVNSFGFGGANAHALLRSPPTSSTTSAAAPEQPSLPRLVLVSGRTREAVDTLLDAVTRTTPPHAGLVALLHSVHEAHMPGHIHRGFVVAGERAGEAPAARDAQHWPGERRPVWFVFAGMGSQWPAMGKELMRLPVFAAAVQRCDAVLAPRGIDIVSIITSDDPAVFDNILNCFVGIAAVQVGMVDVLRAVGVEADYIVGHSVGELGCAYADGCLSAEQTVLAAYSRGRASLEAPLVAGAMAAVGLSAAEAVPLCPADVDVACHNGPGSCTVSGPAASLRAFVKELQARGVFAKEVASAGIAYHSRYIAPAGPLLLRYLQEVIPEARARSPRWLSSSVAEKDWATPQAQLCSAEYLTNNLLSAVRFEPLLAHVPDNAVTIEIAPHGLLQAILKRGLSPEVLNVALARRGANSLQHLLSAIGKLYCAGLLPRPAALYPPPQWPVPRGTPMISPLVRWEHSDDWFVTNFQMRQKADSAERVVKLEPKDEENDTMLGHIIDGRPLLPATGYLKMAWDTLAMLEGRIHSELPVVFENIRLHRATPLPLKQGEVLELSVIIHRGSGDWEVSDKGTVVASGRIRAMEDAAKEMMLAPPEPSVRRPAPVDAVEIAEGADADGAAPRAAAPAPPPAVGDAQPDFDMSSRHVYKCLRLRGYNYQGMFRGIQSASIDGKRALIKWNSYWVAYLDAFLQLKILSTDSTQLYVPTSIDKVVVDTRRHGAASDGGLYEAVYHPELDVISSASVEIRGLQATPIARRRTLAEPVLEKYTFVPFDGEAKGEAKGEAEGEGEWEAADALRVCVQLMQENRPPVTRVSPPVRVAELLAPPRPPLVPLLAAALADLPMVQAKASVFVPEGAEVEESALGGAATAPASKLAAERDVALLVLSAASVGVGAGDALANAAASLGVAGCLLARRGAAEAPLSAAAAAAVGLRLALSLRLRGGERLQLFRKGGWRVDASQLHVVRVPELAQEEGEGEGDAEEQFAWVARLQEALRDPNPAEKRVVLVARGPLNGALGLCNCLRQEPGAGQRLVRLYLLPEEADEGQWDEKAWLQRLRPRLELDLAVNVLQGGRWGSLRHLQLPASLEVPARHAYVFTAVRGDLSSLSWFQGRIDLDRPAEKDGLARVHIHYSALNFRDIMVATGKLDGDALACHDSDSYVGIEFSGRTEDGRRVMGMRMGGAIATEIQVDPKYLLEVPDNWTLQQAATVPCAYSTVVYALEMVGRMVPGESVLVHAASGAVGQAALTLALARGCRVFATVGTIQKRAFLLRTFPQLSPDDIGNSRDTSFEALVLRRTAGRGVDLVLNSLAEDKLQASLRCLGTGGRFLEIGKVDIFNNSAIGMRLFLRRASVHGILLDDAVMDPKSEECDEIFLRMRKLIKEGIIRPVEAEVFGRDEVEKAFRHMAAGKHVGKVLIAVRPGEQERGVAPSPPLALPARPRFYCQPDASYVLVGGLGGLGLELAHWLVQRGARHLVLVSRRGVTTGYQARRLQQWRAKGVRALVRTDDAATRRGADELLRAAAAVAPVAAVFNLAVVLRDALFDSQTAAAFAESFRCKATAAVRLDAASRRLCPRLRHFVLFSSVSCGRGNAGQTNYGLANSVMERVAAARRAAGLPATAVQWGAVGDVGLVADMRDDDRVLEIGGTLQQSLQSCLDVLDRFLAEPHAVLSSMVVAEKRGGAAGDDMVSTVAALMGFKDLKTLSMESSLSELGMDSMMAEEIRQTMARDFDIVLTPQDVRSLTFGRLREMQRVKNAKERKALEAPAPSAPVVPAVIPGFGFAADAIDVLLEVAQEDSKKTVFSWDYGTDKSSLTTQSALVLFPGIAGSARTMEVLARNLAIKSVALQIPRHTSLDASVQETVDVLIKRVKEQIGSKPKSGFALLGYSYGGLVALEAAAQLEAEGYRGGHLVLLDSSPQIMCSMSKSAFGIPDGVDVKAEDLSKSKSEMLVMLKSFLSILANGLAPDMPVENMKKIQTELRLKDTWEACLRYFAENGVPHLKASTELKMDTAEAITGRINAALVYRWPESRAKLQSKVTLIRPAQSLLPEGIPLDGGLSQICQQPVVVHSVEDATHNSLIANMQTVHHVRQALGYGKLA